MPCWLLNTATCTSAQTPNRPAPRAGDHRRSGDRELANPDPEPWRPGQQVGGGERGHDHPALEQLGHEGEPDERAAPGQVLGASGPASGRQRPRGVVRMVAYETTQAALAATRQG